MTGPPVTILMVDQNFSLFTDPSLPLQARKSWGYIESEVTGVDLGYFGLVSYSGTWLLLQLALLSVLPVSV